MPVHANVKDRYGRLRDAAGKYLDARRALETPASGQSRRGLDWMNFFIADVQSGFGTFVAFYLAQLGWAQSSVGAALTAGTISGVLSKIPGGAVADALQWKRGLAAAGILMIGTAALILALAPSFVAVFLAEILHGVTAGIITPAIAAISLGLVGRRAMSVRTGRNYRYAAGGHALTAALMGVTGAFLSENAMFIAAASLCIPALFFLSRIRPDEIDYARARNANKEQAANVARVLDLAKNRGLVLFTVTLVLFQLADASMLPLVGENLAGAVHGHASLWMSGLIIVPQIIVAIFAPWVGYHSERRGRRPLLVIGFAAEPIRAGVLALTAAYPFLVVAQVLDGISGAIIGVLTVIVITDLTAGTGRFNLAYGTVTALSGVAASVSTGVTGVVSQTLGRTTAFLLIAAIASSAVIVSWLFLSETRPENYPD
jgi:MFS family permease